MRRAIYNALHADSALLALLPGGLYDAAEVGEISRQATPAAFNANGELLACALVRYRGQNSLAAGSPYRHGARSTVEVYFYNPPDDQARERVYDRLHDVRLSPAGGSDAANWRIEHADDVLAQEDPALKAGLQVSRYQVLIRRR